MTKTETESDAQGQSGAQSGSCPPLPSPLPLCSLTVANEERALQAGKCVIFDDSFLHEAVNRAGSYEASDSSSGPRVVLIIDVWHPDLSAEEVVVLH